MSMTSQNRLIFVYMNNIEVLCAQTYVTPIIWPSTENQVPQIGINITLELVEMHEIVR